MLAPGDSSAHQFEAPPDRSAEAAMVRGTVVVVDMVGYSDIAKLLEQNISAGSVAELNRQIQGLIAASLSALPSSNDSCIIARTGDGAILMFESADDAHAFSRSLHLLAREHSEARTEATAKRWFRIGAATGFVNRSLADNSVGEFAGITIANAVRLEDAARKGEIVIDSATFAALSPALKSLYGVERIVRGKRNETFPAHRLRVIAPEAKTPKVQLPKVTRRNLFGLVAGTGAAVAVGSWFAAEPLREWLHPLPHKRFVALIAWPETAQEARSVLARVLKTIGTRIARAEFYIPDLLVIPESDLAEQSNAPQTTPPNRQPIEIANLLGATLIFTAHTVMTSDLATITLQVLDAANSGVLRHKKVHAALNDLAGLNEKASLAAVRMLELPLQEVSLTDEEELRHVPPKAYRAFVDAQSLFDAPNDSQLESAIASFQEAIAAAPSFAGAYAALALAYARKYHRYSNDADIALASNNAQRAVDLNPGSISGLLAQSEVLAYTGKSSDALDTIARAQKIDPSNPDILLYKAQVYGDLGQFEKQEAVYKDIIRHRPSYWKAYNELGVVLKSEARYKLAEQAFNQASELAPHASLPLANMAMMYLLQGQNKSAEDEFQRALQKSPDEIAFTGLGDLAFANGRYPDALEFYRSASLLNPGNSANFRDMGDCYTKMAKPELVRENYGHAADLLFTQLQLNPKRGKDWATLAFYDAKSGNPSRAIEDLANAEERKVAGVESDVDADFDKAQALAVLGRKEEALALVLECLRRGLSPLDVSLALDLAWVTSEPKYRTRVAQLHNR